ncbi:hypothetical protein PAP18089_01917 [Pandoraea apista]|uniref:Phage tail assembly protein n=1 Tax=Pandoraea apista TaxID=93218 RepID=A0A5E5P3T2_9BURK|nr:phage tail assembly protein [Pandoraea apista]VVG70945.1 hypothetical protein PAP18089_01917 [Pandoraea apista]
MEIKLTKPIKAHGEQVSVLTLREPTGEEVRKVGALPYDVHGAAGNMIPQARVALKYAAICAGVPPSSLDQLSAVDSLVVVNTVVGMFAGTEKPTVSLREPSGREVRMIGALPFFVALDGISVSMNTTVAMRYIATLADMTDEQVDALQVADLTALCWDVTRFFSGGGSEPSTS